MKLKGKIQLTEDYSGNSEYSFFQELIEGDILTIELDLIKARLGGILQSPNVYFINELGDVFETKFNRAVNYLKTLQYKVI